MIVHFYIGLLLHTGVADLAAELGVAEAAEAVEQLPVLVGQLGLGVDGDVDPDPAAALGRLVGLGVEQRQLALQDGGEGVCGVGGGGCWCQLRGGHSWARSR